MAGRSDPPEGTPPEGLPNSDDDDYRSVVFDESFVRAAQLQEFSASERAGDHAPAVRTLPPVSAAPAAAGNSRKQVSLMMLLVVLAFSTAVYMGARAPVTPVSEHHPQVLRATVVPLAPTGRVPGGESAELFLHSPAAQFRTGAEGIQLPVARSTPHFSESQVLAALTIAKDYLVQSSVDPAVLTGRAVRPVRLLLDPDQQEQFDASFTPGEAGGPGTRSGVGGGSGAGAGGGAGAGAGGGAGAGAESGSVGGPQAGTGTSAVAWMVRFDPARVALAGTTRANGTLRVTEVGPGLLDVTTDHTFVYPLRPVAPTDAGSVRSEGGSERGEAGSERVETAGSERVETAGSERVGDASLFTVRRELHFRYDAEDLRRHRAELLGSYAAGGPQACGAFEASSPSWQPLLAGRKAPATGAAGPAGTPVAGTSPGVPTGTDPYATGAPAGAVCGTLAQAAMPSPRPG